MLPHERRKSLANSLSAMFGGEVPEYLEFTEIVRQSNEDFLRDNPGAQVDSEHRVLAEKHGAIRVGTAEEMRIVTRIFKVFGMEPVEFYDMTQLPKGALPMIATAFRSIDETIEHSALRIFCSMLHPDYIPDEVKDKVNAELDKRREGNPKFSARLLELLTLAESGRGFTPEQEQEFIVEVVNSFRINKDRAIDFDLYRKLRTINDALADIICIGINLNHMTPRAYAPLDAARRLEERGIPMKDGGMEGPPLRDNVPPIQLNQTSRKAPGEALYVSDDPEVLKDPALFQRLKDQAVEINLDKGEDVKSYLERIGDALTKHRVAKIQHKARFGEIEARGVALTVEGETEYKALLAEKKFRTHFPTTHRAMFYNNLAYYTFRVTDAGLAAKASIKPGTELHELIKLDYVRLEPQTYNDFLAASAAGIFASNMTSGTKGMSEGVVSDTVKNKAILERALGRGIISRHVLHKGMKAESVLKVYEELGLQVPAPLRVTYERDIQTMQEVRGLVLAA